MAERKVLEDAFDSDSRRTATVRGATWSPSRVRPARSWTGARTSSPNETSSPSMRRAARGSSRITAPLPSKACGSWRWREKRPRRQTHPQRSAYACSAYWDARPAPRGHQGGARHLSWCGLLGRYGHRRPSRHRPQRGRHRGPRRSRRGDSRGPRTEKPGRPRRRSRERLRRTSIFARVSPEQKLNLIALHQVACAVVARTGTA